MPESLGASRIVGGAPGGRRGRSNGARSGALGRIDFPGGPQAGHESHRTTRADAKAEDTMTDPGVAETYLESEVESLAPLQSIVIRPSLAPTHALEVMAGPTGQLDVRIPGRPLTVPSLSAAERRGLLDRGFTSENPSDASIPWTCHAADASAAVRLVQHVLTEIFQEKPEAALDIAHASHELEYETRRKVEAARKRIEAALAGSIQGTPQQDADGDYVLGVDHMHVVVSPRALPGGQIAVRVFAITNLGVRVTPDLGLLIARLNFGLVFGRLALDAEHQSVWIDETLLGDQFTDEQLLFAIRVVSSLAHEWADQIKERFGGSTYTELVEKNAEKATLPAKPGHGLYL